MKRTSSRPFLLGALALLVAALFTACQRAPTGTVTDIDLRRLQGYWEGHGPGGECSVTISGNSLVYYGRDDFWYETTFTLPAGTNLPELHATIIKDSSTEQADVGTVVVAIFEIEDETLTLAVVEDSEELPPDVIGDLNWTLDRYYLKRVQTNRPRTP